MRTKGPTSEAAKNPPTDAPATQRGLTRAIRELASKQVTSAAKPVAQEATRTIRCDKRSNKGPVSLYKEAESRPYSTPVRESESPIKHPEQI
jgi:hypothetical protein